MCPWFLEPSLTDISPSVTQVGLKYTNYNGAVDPGNVFKATGQETKQIRKGLGESKR